MKHIVVILLFFVNCVVKAQITPLNQKAFSLLQQQDLSYPYHFVVIGDTREGYDIENDVIGDYSSMISSVFLDILQELETLTPKPDFIINLGDAVLGVITDEDNNPINEYQQQYPAYYYYISNFMQNTQIPFFTIPGNHEFWIEWNDNLFTEYIGNLRDCIDYGNMRLIWLNNGMNNTGNGWENYWFTLQDLFFVQSKLSETGRPPVTFTACHVPLYVANDLTEQYQRISFESYYNMLKNNNITANFSAHQHNYQRYLYCEDGVIDIVSGGGGAELHDTPPFPPYSAIKRHHFLLVTISENNRAKVQMYFYQEGHSSEAAKYDFIIPETPNETIDNWIHYVVIPEGAIYYYSAYETETVAGNGRIFLAEHPSYTEITAGQSIIFKSGTKITGGARLKAYITNFNCNESLFLNNKKMIRQ